MKEREKLYKQMEIDYDKLSQINKDKLLIFLDTEKRIGKMSFKYYSEFLNILNTFIFFYACSIDIKSNPLDIPIFLILDLNFIISALIYYFITKNGKIKSIKSNIIIFPIIGLIISELLFSKCEYIVDYTKIQIYMIGK